MDISNVSNNSKAEGTSGASKKKDLSQEGRRKPSFRIGSPDRNLGGSPDNLSNPPHKVYQLGSDSKSRDPQHTESAHGPSHQSESIDYPLRPTQSRSHVATEGWRFLQQVNNLNQLERQNQQNQQEIEHLNTTIPNNNLLQHQSKQKIDALYKEIEKLKLQRIEDEFQSEIEKTNFQIVLNAQQSETQEHLTQARNQDQQEIDNLKSQLEQANKLNKKLQSQLERADKLARDDYQSARLYREKYHEANQQLDRYATNLDKIIDRPAFQKVLTWARYAEQSTYPSRNFLSLENSLKNLQEVHHEYKRTLIDSNVNNLSNKDKPTLESTQKDKDKQIIDFEAQRTQGHLKQGESSNAHAIVPRSTDGILQNIPSNAARGDLIPASQSAIAQQADRALRQNLIPEDNGTSLLNRFARGVGSLVVPELHKQQVIKSTQRELVVFDAIADNIYKKGVKAMEDAFALAEERYQPEIDKLFEELRKYDRGTKEYERIIEDIDRKFEESQQYRGAMCNQVLNTVGKLTPFAPEINRQLRSVGATSKSTEIINNAATNFGTSLYLVRFGS